MRHLLLIILCSGLLAGCSATLPQDEVWRPRLDGLFWPPPPDPVRIKYLRTLTGPRDFAKKSEVTAVLDWLLGERELSVPLLTPVAVAADGKGMVWVADSSSKMVYRFDLARERVDYFRQAGNVSLQSPSGVVFDQRTGQLFVADALLGKVFIFDDEGGLLGERIPPDGFQRPGGVALDPAGSLYVADAMRGEVLVFSASGAFQRAIGSSSSADGRFQRPTQVAVGPHGEVVVVDALRFLVEVQDPAGKLLGIVGKIGDVPGSFARPRGVALDSKGHLYVADAAFDNIQIFDLTGQLLMHWGGPGSQHGQFNLPAGVFIDGNDRIYVADSYNHRVEVFAYLDQRTALRRPDSGGAVVAKE